MKKTLMLLSAICVTLLSYAQTTGGTRPGIGFGIRAGVNVAQVKIKVNNTEMETGHETGLNAGIFANIPAGANFSIQPELAYSRVGYEIENSSPAHQGKYGYLTLPVLAKYTFPTSGFSIYAGPQANFLLSAKQEIGGTEYDVKGSVKSTDIAGVFGFEFQFPNTGFLVSGRYQAGLSNIERNRDNNREVKINGATFSLGYRF